jgi:serine/threonine-protein kinase HipA
MIKKPQQQIEVHAAWNKPPQSSLIGTLSITPSRNKEIFSFEYDTDWLKSSNPYVLDPALQLFQGPQYAPIEQKNFGVFLDSSPDRWGRFLMNRREAQLARKEKRKARQLLESDYLLGVYDAHRMGALRFRTEATGPFLDNNHLYASPPWTALRELEYASLALEKEDVETSSNNSKWLTMLIAPGGSLGGARPKASVLDEHQHLWIAKFPSGNDQTNIGAWEMVAHQLAKKAGINMASAMVKQFNSPHHTFLSKRFDRKNKHERVHFASAMTLLQRTDGDNASNGTSYLELVAFILREGANVGPDLEELWRRIVFSICISNTDDHLRNHGFILNPEQGWLLSPAYDVNPVTYSDGLKLNISETENTQSLALAEEVAELFRLKPKQAKDIIKNILRAVNHWHKEATQLKIPKKEQDYMANAFRFI